LHEELIHFRGGPDAGCRVIDGELWVIKLSHSSSGQILFLFLIGKGRGGARGMMLRIQDSRWWAKVK
jgi:hypothetical protein